MPMPVLLVLFAFCLIVALLMFWYTFRVNREQQALEQDIHALQDRFMGSSS
jgi:type VI protein secretion system component VasF